MRPKPNRTAGASILLRCTAEEKQTLEAACAKLQEDLPYAKVTANSFVLGVALKEARAVLKRGDGGGRSPAEKRGVT